MDDVLVVFGYVIESFRRRFGEVWGTTQIGRCLDELGAVVGFETTLNKTNNTHVNTIKHQTKLKRSRCQQLQDPLNKQHTANSLALIPWKEVL